MQKGFTLIETLIYSAVLAVFLSFVFYTTTQILESTRRTRSQSEVYDEADFIFKKIAWAVTSASAVNIPAPNATSTTLSVNKINFPDNPLIFSWDGLNVFLARGGGAPIMLNSSRARVSAVLFQKIYNATTSQTFLRVTLAVENKPIQEITIFNASTTLETTYTL